MLFENRQLEFTFQDFQIVITKKKKQAKNEIVFQISNSSNYSCAVDGTIFSLDNFFKWILSLSFLRVQKRPIICFTLCHPSFA